MEKIRCSECEWCKKYQKLGNKRAEYFCGHPAQGYIDDYFHKKRLQKAPGFLDYGRPECVPIKTSPAWCPRNRKDEKNRS